VGRTRIFRRDPCGVWALFIRLAGPVAERRRWAKFRQNLRWRGKVYTLPGPKRLVTVSLLFTFRKLPPHSVWPGDASCDIAETSLCNDILPENRRREDSRDDEAGFGLCVAALAMRVYGCTTKIREEADRALIDHTISSTKRRTNNRNLHDVDDRAAGSSRRKAQPTQPRRMRRRYQGSRRCRDRGQRCCSSRRLSRQRHQGSGQL